MHYFVDFIELKIHYFSCEIIKLILSNIGKVTTSLIGKFCYLEGVKGLYF